MRILFQLCLFKHVDALVRDEFVGYFAGGVIDDNTPPEFMLTGLRHNTFPCHLLRGRGHLLLVVIQERTPGRTWVRLDIRLVYLQRITHMQLRPRHIEGIDSIFTAYRPYTELMSDGIR